MYRVVIIDDEQIIVEGLRRVVDWAAYGCQVVADAGDARSGAQCIREWKPDILFTDIKMPGEDGLTMLAGLKAEFSRMQVTVLTGYRDFDYAQRALHLGVSRFLLKPSHMEELEEAILSGAYPEESQVPSITEYSVQYRINPATALKGINLLVDAGLLYKKRGVGMFVASGAREKLRQSRRERFYQDYVQRMVREARNLGLTDQELRTLLERGMKEDGH